MTFLWLGWREAVKKDQWNKYVDEMRKKSYEDFSCNYPYNRSPRHGEERYISTRRQRQKGKPKEVGIKNNESREREKTHTCTQTQSTLSELVN
jgi:alpha-galactosidase/6-phospho-beta-glucosidase family protein